MMTLGSKRVVRLSLMLLVLLAASCSLLLVVVVAQSRGAAQNYALAPLNEDDLRDEDDGQNREEEAAEEEESFFPASQLDDVKFLVNEINAARGRSSAQVGLRRRQAVPRIRREHNNNGKHNSLVGLRRIQRRPELVDLSDELRDVAAEWPLVRNYTSGHQEARAQQQQKRSPPKKKSQVEEQLPAAAAHKFFYVISPVSEQILPIQSEKITQGFESLLSLPGGNYATGLRKLTPLGGTSSLSLALERDLATSATELIGCRTIKSSVQLAKDELEPTSGQLVRHCTGRAELNACEGSCASSIQPSVKSANGLTKKCACCNEASFRRVQVRLNECYLPATIGGGQQAIAVGLPGSYMDIEVDEPVDCKCRSCDNFSV